MSLKNIVFVTFSLLLIQSTFGQKNYDQYNRIGATGGYTIFDINTSDFQTKEGSGFIAGFTTRGAFRNNFDLIYGLSFYSSSLGILGKGANITTGFTEEYVDFSIQGVQLNFLGSYNIVKHHLSLDFGPVVNINGKMKLDNDRYQFYVVDEENGFTAEEIQDISKFNFNVVGGLTAGLESFRISAHYQYGITNTFNKLNDQNLKNSDFEGHTSTIIIAAVVYF